MGQTAHNVCLVLLVPTVMRLIIVLGWTVALMECVLAWKRIGTFHCVCVSGFTGELCQINTDDCMGMDCSGNGRCVDGVNNFTCECAHGFSGLLCSESGTYDLVC